MSAPSTKPYLIRAIHDWCADSGFTPYLTVAVDATVQVPREFVRGGEIVLNISVLATNRLELGNDAIRFQARFGGVARDIVVPIERVSAVFARENGQGMAFEVPTDAASDGAPAGTSAGAAPPQRVQGAGLRVAPLPVGPAPGPTTGLGAVRPSDAAEAGTGAEPASVTPITGHPPDDESPPPAPRPGERPRLTRIK